MSHAASKPLLIVLSAPSGAGKTTLCQNVLDADPGMVRAVTCTTRAPRPGEREGVDYYFLDANGFEQRARAGEFLEHATVYGHRYGTLKSEVMGKLRGGKSVLLNIDVQGAASVRACAAQDPDLRAALVSVFMTPATFAELEERLRGRAQDAPEVIAARLAAARREFAAWQDFDYLLISTTREESLRRMQAVIAAEGMRRQRATPPVF